MRTLIGAFLLICVSSGAWGQSAKRPLSVADMIATTRAMKGPITTQRSSQGLWEGGGGNPVIVSPDGRRYVILLIRGDLEANGVWAELMSGRLDAGAEGARPQSVARLFTKALGAGVGYGSTELLLPGSNPPIWLDDSERVVFFWEDDRGVRQVAAVNVRTRAVEYLTRHASDVVTFGVNRQGVVLYSSAVEYSPARSQELLRNGFVVSNLDALSLLSGRLDGTSVLGAGSGYERYVSVPGTQRPRRVAGGELNPLSIYTRPIFAPDGRTALVVGAPAKISSDWRAYTQDFLKDRIKEALESQHEAALQLPITQFFIVDVADATARPVWNAPIPLPISSDTHAAWSPDGRSVVLGPTFLPTAHADVSGLAGTAFAEVDVATGQFRQLPLPPQAAARGIAKLRWLSAHAIEIVQASGEHLRFRRQRDRWEADVPGRTSVPEAVEASVRVELRESSNTPPAVYAVDVRTGAERMILDLNPGLRDKFALGKVEKIEWNDADGRTWSGVLYYPANFETNRRYPLVIQTRGPLPLDEFSLSGKGGNAPGLGPSYSAYVAQPLAGRGIAVLVAEDKYVPGIVNNPEEPRMHMAGYQAGAEHLVQLGLVDRDKVGIMGFSRGGWRVEYALVHSDFPYAAALAADNLDGGYVQAALFSWRKDLQEITGAAPFGDGLKTWLQVAPAFNVEKIHTPLRIQQESGGLAGLITQWEVFSRLRYLKKPVEFYVIPDIEHGSHALQNPAQVLASQEGALDWWLFWLKREEDPHQKKVEQYIRWRKLRELHELDLAAKEVQVHAQ